MYFDWTNCLQSRNHCLFCICFFFVFSWGRGTDVSNNNAIAPPRAVNGVNNSGTNFGFRLIAFFSTRMIIGGGGDEEDEVISTNKFSQRIIMCLIQGLVVCHRERDSFKLKLWYQDHLWNKYSPLHGLDSYLTRNYCHENYFMNTATFYYTCVKMHI